jgi:hypothetical protein
MLRESQKALLYLEHEAQLAVPNQLTNFPRTTMSLPKTALIAIFLLSVCSPALAAETTVEKPTVYEGSTVNRGNSTPQVAVTQNLKSVRVSQGDQSSIDSVSVRGRFSRETVIDACRAAISTDGRRR